MVEVLPPCSTLLLGQSMQLDDHASSSSVVEDENSVQRPEFGQLIDVKMSPWTELYSAGR